MVMASLVSVDSYLQSLGRKVCEQPRNETPKRKAVYRDPDAPDGPKKKKKKKPRKLRGSAGPAHKPGGPAHKPGGPAHKPPLMITAPQSTGIRKLTCSLQVKKYWKMKDIALSSFSTVDLLRRRLHEKIEESRGQVSNKNLSIEEIQKRREKRKQERERKKRKRKEQKMAEETPVLESTAMEKSAEEPAEDTTPPPIVFNKVEVHDEPLNKVLMKKQKKQFVKGNITPMTGKNYKQLLSRLECRKSKLEELRAKDLDKAKDYEQKIKWTNVLYKAEGLKIKDDEGMLRSALKRKEKRREQRKRRWDNRIQNTAEKMQQRQDKRNRNIKKKKTSKLEKKKNRARKRGRIMPEDLAKNNVK